MNPGTTIPSEARNRVGVSAAIAALPGILETAGSPEELIGMYGYGCRLHPDLWYKPMQIRRGRLASFLGESLERGIFAPGLSDLHLKAKGGAFEIFVSHEGDIRLSGNDPALVSTLASQAALAGIQVVVVRPSA